MSLYRAVPAALCAVSFACAGVHAADPAPAAAAASESAKASGVMAKGVTAGEWTQDLDAAKKYAAEHNLPLMLNFTGSDWCPYCVQMEKAVFSKKEWKEYAARNLVMVFVDFPKKHKDLVPAEYVARNEALQEQYGVQGFPTYVVLDSTGAQELGRLSAMPEGTPAQFEKAFREVVRFTEAALKSFSATVNKKDEAAMAAKAGELIAKQKQLAELKQQVDTLRKDVDAILRNDRLVKLGDKAADLVAAEKKLAEAKVSLKAWLETSPDRSKENQEKFGTLRKAIQDAQVAVDAF